MISIKAHSRGSELLIAACDSDLLDKTFRSGKLRLHVSREFYHAEECDEEMLVSRLEMATVANLVGRRTVAAAGAHGLVAPCTDCEDDLRCSASSAERRASS